LAYETNKNEVNMSHRDKIRTSLLHYNGEVYEMQEEAYIVGKPNEKPFYKAHCLKVDSSAIGYIGDFLAIWPVYDHYEEIENEEDMYNWDDFHIEEVV
jgi:hypothetical protein